MPLFFDWFKIQFIPEVKGSITHVNRQLRALLILDNAPSHSKTDGINFDPSFEILFLPPNCTAILQPLHQNLIQNVKVIYGKQLLQPITASCWDDEDMLPLQFLCYKLPSDSIYDGIKSIRNKIRAMNIYNDISEEDINDWALVEMNFHSTFPKVSFFS